MARILPTRHTAGHMAFIGVSTGSSSIMRVFPRWAEILGLPTSTLIGSDLPLDAPPERFRQEVLAIREDPEHRGALVTTHKMALYEAAADLFDELDTFAHACGEISSISKRGDRLHGHAKDPLTSSLALDDFLPSDAFAAGQDAVVLGAGGAGLALTWSLVEREDRPRRIVVTDPDPERLHHLEAVHRRRGTPPDLLSLTVTEPETTTTLLAAAPEGSLVVNATGLGKDRPGSPVPQDAVFPPSRLGVGVQLPRKPGFPRASACPARYARAGHRGRLAVLHPWLVAGDRRSVRHRDDCADRRAAQRGRRGGPHLKTVRTDDR